MTVKQLSVFVENRAGRLSAVTRLLGDNNLSIKAMSIADTKDFGILRLIMNDSEKALDVLKENGFSVTITNVLAIKIQNKPGGLADAMEVLYKGNVSVEYMYAAFIKEDEGTAFLILRVDNNDLAVKTLTENGYSLVGQEELLNI